MAATTVNDFYLRYVSPDADEPTLMRVSRQATVGWGVVQLGVALGAQWMDRSVLDAGLAVLSFASGAVLGAFLLGTLMPRVGERDALVGMIAGLVDDDGVWGWTTRRLHLVRVHRRGDDVRWSPGCCHAASPAPTASRDVAA